MNKRKLDSETEITSAPNEVKKAFVEDSSSDKETVASVISQEPEDLEEEKELEIRDKLLEESSVSLKINQLVNTDGGDPKVIKLKGKLPNLSLPPGWIALSHRSGGIIYLHRQSRVCTWARPYHLGDASVRKHDVPTAAIPCLHQLKALRESGHKKPNKGGCSISNDFVMDVNDGGSEGSGGNYENSHQHGNHTNEGRQDSCHDNSDTFCHLGDAGSSESQPGHDSSKNLDNAMNNLDNKPSRHLNEASNNLDNNPENLGGDLSIGHNPDSNFTSNSLPGNIYHDNFENSDSNIVNECKDNNHHIDGTRDFKSDTDSQTSENYTGQDQNESVKKIFQISSGEIEMTTRTELSDYLSKLWDFQSLTEEQEKLPLLNCRDYKTHKDDQENSSTDVLQTIPFLIQGSDPNQKNKDKFLINPAGKSPQSLLHEYCSRVLKLKPTYKTVESGNAKTPFMATVEIDGLQYGTGIGASKKQARHVAAQATLDIFIPGTYEKLLDIGQHLKVFDDVAIEDPNVYELTSKIGLMSPFQVLSECVKRNQGVLSSEVKFEMHYNSDRKIFYSIECGKHKATGPCRNKKSGRELAAQALLKKLHPHLSTWGSLLRIYVDKHSIKEFTKTDDKNLCSLSSSSMNRELLSDLKHEMWKLLKDRKSNHFTSFTGTDLTDIDY